MDISLIKKWAFYLGLLGFSTAFAETFQGYLQVLVIDKKNNTSEYVYKLQESNTNYELLISTETFNKYQLHTGDAVIIEGDVVVKGEQNTIKVNSISKSKSKPLKESIVGQRNVLTLMVNFTDMQATNTVSVSSLDAQLYNNPTSVKNNYAVSSSNQLIWMRTLDPNNNPGIYPVSLNYAAGTSCDVFKWGQDATNAAIQAGINVNAYIHTLYILPNNVNCNFGGLAYLGCYPGYCLAWVVGYGGADISGLMAHELGHNLGLNHASSNLNNSGNIQEYGDESDFMGPGSNRQANVPHRDLQHWYDAFPGKISTVTASGQYIISSLDINDQMLQAIRVNKKNNSGTYYISYRTNTAPFGMGAPFNNAISVHYTVPGGDQHSYLVTTLGAGQTFVDTANGVTISVLATYMNCAAIINVSVS